MKKMNIFYSNSLISKNTKKPGVAPKVHYPGIVFACIKRNIVVVVVVVIVVVVRAVLLGLARSRGHVVSYLVRMLQAIYTVVYTVKSPCFLVKHLPVSGSTLLLIFVTSSSSDLPTSPTTKHIGEQYANTVN